MSFNPLLPANGAPIVAAELRSQFTGLHDEIAAVPAITGAQVDTVNTGSPGSSASAGVTLNGGVLHFDFTIPAGEPGEVTQAQLSNDLVNCQNAAVLTVLPMTSNNSNGVTTLSMTANTSYDPSEMQAVINKMDELINALRR